MKTKIRKSKECLLPEELFKKSDIQKAALSDIEWQLRFQRANSLSEEDLRNKKREEQLLVRAKQGLST